MTYPEAEFEIERQNVRPTTKDAKLTTETP